MAVRASLDAGRSATSVERLIAERDEAVEARDIGRNLAHPGRLQTRHPAGEPFELELPRGEDGRGAFEPA